MICLRCENEKAEDEMASKSKGHLRRWCKACDAKRRRDKNADRLSLMHSNVMRVSAELGRIIVETGAKKWVQG